MAEMYMGKKELKLISRLCYAIVHDEIKEKTEKIIAAKLLNKVNKRLYLGQHIERNYITSI